MRWVYVRGFDFYHGLWDPKDGVLIKHDVWKANGLRRLRDANAEWVVTKQNYA
jgi:hypothetical protein